MGFPANTDKEDINFSHLMNGRGLQFHHLSPENLWFNCKHIELETVLQTKHWKMSVCQYVSEQT